MHGQGVVFWLLMALGLTGITPCVLLPEWRQYEALCLAEQRASYRLAELQSIVDQKRAAYGALRDDPAVIARLARRELGYVRPQERTVRVAGFRDELGSAPDKRFQRHGREATGASFVPEPVDPPAMMAGVIDWLPSLDYDAVFCDDRTRSTILTMSFGLIALAFVLFGRSTPRTSD